MISIRLKYTKYNLIALFVVRVIIVLEMKNEEH